MATKKSGYQATLTAGTYTGASLTEVSISVDGKVVDVSDLSSEWRTNVLGTFGWEVTGTKNAGTEVFLDLLKATGSAQRTSIAVAVKNPTGSTIFSGVGFVSRAHLVYPQGAATEDVTIVGTGVAPVIT